MKKNDKTKKIIIIAIVALVGLFLLFSSVKDSLISCTGCNVLEQQAGVIWTYCGSITFISPVSEHICG